MARLRVGILGCGAISGIYLKNLTGHPAVEVVACADLDASRAQEASASFGIPLACSPADLLALPQVDLVLNLTVPLAHYATSLAALQAGKHVYGEKPLAATVEQGSALAAEARRLGLRVGAAPDTFLGGGLQTCRALIDQGAIGEPVAATAFMLCRGHERWHPNPDFYYQPGGGPMMDMGPYYITALASLLGPVQRVSGAARATWPTRTVGSESRKGEVIPVEVPTHITGMLEFESGPLATIVTSFDVWPGNAPMLEIYGSEGTLSLPDPNTFGGPVRIRRRGSDWEEVEITLPHTENARSIGLIDLAQAIEQNRPHRCSAELALHTLEVMEAIEKSAVKGRRIEMTTRCGRPDSTAVHIM
jgi:predicted dehydrogenase